MAWDRHRLERPKCKKCGKEMMKVGPHWVCPYCANSGDIVVIGR